MNIGIIGKYVNLKDAYKSLDEALIHGGISNNVNVNLILQSFFGLIKFPHLPQNANFSIQ